MITAAEVNNLIRYDEATGYLHWKVNSGPVKIGDRAGSFHKSSGYIQIKIKGIRYEAHRIIWLMQYGEFPPEEIDHINQVRTDNRLTNLRSVTHQENQRNVPRRKNNTSGACGVRWDKVIQNWSAQITIDKKQIHLGCFDDWFEAVCARKAADYKYSFHINHGRDQE